MDEEKINGVALKGSDSKENDRIIRLYTLERGRISAALKGVKKAGAKLKAAGQSFSFGEYVLAGKGAVKTVTAYSAHETFSELYSRGVGADSYFAASYVAETFDKCTPAAEANPELFLLLLKTFREFISGVNPKTVLTAFIIGFLRASGYRYNFSECAVCGAERRGAGKFDARSGGVTCPHCAGPFGADVSPAVGNLMRLLADGGIGDMSAFRFEDADLTAAFRLLNGILEETFETALFAARLV